MLSRQFWTILISSLLFSFFSNAQCLTEIPNQPLSANALTNPSFETSTVGERPLDFSTDASWGYFNINGGPRNQIIESFPSPGNQCGANEVVPRTGNNMLKMFGKFFAVGNQNDNVVFSDRVPVAGGQNYLGGMYALSPTDADCPVDNLEDGNRSLAIISLQFFDGSGNFLEECVSGTFTSDDATGDWIRFESYAQAPSDAMEAQIVIVYIHFDFEEGAIFFDDAFLHQVQTPTAPTMGEWGIMILGLLILIIGIVAIKQTSFSTTKATA